MKSHYKKDGFENEKFIVIPTESFANYLEHPLVNALFITDIGFFPEASYHYRERKEGIDEFILIYCTGGRGFIEIEGQKIELQSNKLFCIPKNAGHKYYADEKDPWSILWVHFKGENVKYFPLNNKEVRQLGSSEANERLMYLFKLLIDMLEINYTLGNFIYEAQVLALILAEIYYRESSLDLDKQNQYLRKAIHYMYRNLDKDLTLEDIAEHMKLSKSYLNNIFNKYANRAPIDFYIYLKMQQACKYFRMTDMKVYEVGKKLGYEDQYYFSRIFKKMIGISPMAYKKNDQL